MKKILLLTILLLVLAGCSEFFTGKKITATDEAGKTTTTYEEAPIESWTAILATLIPGGLALGALGRMVAKGSRTKNALMDANKKAIEDADWSKINSAESFKEILKLAQDSHDDSKLIKKEYDKWKNKGKV